MRLYGLLPAVLCLSAFSLVEADTEILNFASQRVAVAIIPPEWNQLTASNSSQVLSITPSSTRGVHEVVSHERIDGLCEFDNSIRSCEGDLWLVLDLDDWCSVSDPDTLERKFTARISWPASTPADFHISVYSPKHLFEALKGNSGPPTPPRARNEMVDIDSLKGQQLQERWSAHIIYLRIRASTMKFVRAPHPDGGVLPFQHVFPSWFLPAPSFKGIKEDVGPLKFYIIIEPLLLGVLPESLVPGLTLLSLLLFITGVFVVPRILSIFERLAERVRKGKGKVE